MTPETVRLIKKYVISIENHKVDGFTLSTVSNGYFIHNRYIDFDIDEAVADFVRTKLSKIKDIRCDECNLPFTLEEWHNRHTAKDGIGDIHERCCKVCE